MQGRPTMYRSRSTSWQHFVISMKLQSDSLRQLPRTYSTAKGGGNTARKIDHRNATQAQQLALSPLVISTHAASW